MVSFLGLLSVTISHVRKKQVQVELYCRRSTLFRVSDKTLLESDSFSHKKLAFKDVEVLFVYEINALLTGIRFNFLICQTFLPIVGDFRHRSPPDSSIAEKMCKASKFLSVHLLATSKKS